MSREETDGEPATRLPAGSPQPPQEAQDPSSLWPAGSSENHSSPLRAVVAALVLSIAAVSWLAWSEYSRLGSIADLDRMLVIDQSHQAIVNLDEVLTTSARMATETGEARWEERYRRFEPMLADEIHRLESFVSTPSVSRAIAQTDTANQKLVAMEHRVFELMGQGERARACQILDSERYRNQKDLFASGMGVLADRIRHRASQEISAQRSSVAGALWLSLAIFSFLALAWLFALRDLQAWRCSVVRSGEERDELVQSLAASQSHLAATLRAVLDGLIVIEEDGRIHSFNAAAGRIFHRSEAQMIGENVSLLMSEPHRSEHDGHLRRYLETGRKRIIGSDREVMGLRADGTEFPLDLSVSEFWSEGRRFFLGMVRDISERKRREEDLLEATRAAQAAMAAKDEFLSNMSHEIRTPMNGTLGMTDLLFSTDLSEEQRDYAEAIQSSGRALLDIINDILDFSKIEAGRVEIESIDFDLRQTIDDIVRMMAVIARDKGIELISMIHYDVPVALRGDPGRLRQILVNLVGNALKFTSEGEVVLDVVAVDSAATRTRLSFRISDTGIGIPADRLEDLFDPFTQADVSMTRRFGGTGLGLSISKSLAALMGGQLSAESHEGVGSTFCLEVPFERQPAELQSIAQPRANLAGLRVLIADSNQTCQRVLRHYCGTWKMEAESVETADRALEILRFAAESGSPYDLVILDSRISAIDGFELAREIRADSRLSGVRQILLSSTALRGEGRRAQTSGADAYLVKPVSRSRLFDCVAQVMGRPLARAGASEPLVTQFTLEKLARSQRPRILVVDDAPMNCKLAVCLLENMGLQTEVAHDGVEAVHAMESGAYDLVLMDCQMPEMDGFEATRVIREKEAPSGRHTPILALTANALAGDRDRCLEAGMDDYLAKPFRRSDLEAAVEKWLAPAPDLT